MESTLSIVRIKNSPFGSVIAVFREPINLILQYAIGSLVDASMTFPEISVGCGSGGAWAEILKKTKMPSTITNGSLSRIYL